MATAGGGSNSKADFQIYRYRLVRKIGSGSFGDIYLGVNITNGEVRGGDAERMPWDRSYMFVLVEMSP